MEKKEAIEVIEKELGKKATDKRRKSAKAVRTIRNLVDWDEEKLEQIIDETIREFDAKYIREKVDE